MLIRLNPDFVPMCSERILQDDFPFLRSGTPEIDIKTSVRSYRFVKRILSELIVKRGKKSASKTVQYFFCGAEHQYLSFSWCFTGSGNVSIMLFPFFFTHYSSLIMHVSRQCASHMRWTGLFHNLSCTHQIGWELMFGLSSWTMQLKRIYPTDAL